MANSDPLVADPSTEIIFEVSEDEVDGRGFTGKRNFALFGLNFCFLA